MAVEVAGHLLGPSQNFCEELTRKAAKNFYYGLKLLPEKKREAMYALYAYMRMVDDIADDEDSRTPDDRARDLKQWQELTHSAIAMDEQVLKRHVLWPAFAKTVNDYKMPSVLFDDMIAGQTQDLVPAETKTFEDLYLYCYRVAGIVGLASLCVWGVKDGMDEEKAKKMAVDLGLAFQLTNILRDLKEDSHRGRVYLPTSELTEYHVNPKMFKGEESDANFLQLMRFQIGRAEGYYQSSSGLTHCICEDSRPTLIAMIDIYHGILKKISAKPEQVLMKRVSLSTLEKLMIGWKAMRGK